MHDTVTRIQASSISANQLDDLKVALSLAESHNQRLQSENEGLASQADALSDELSRREVEIGNLRDVKETSEDAIAGLEGILLKIETQVCSVLTNTLVTSLREIERSTYVKKVHLWSVKAFCRYIL